MTTYSTAGALELDLRLPAGDIEVQTHDAATTSVQLEPLRTDEATLEAIAAARVELVELGAGAQRLTVVVEERRRSFGGSPEVRIRVRCPHGARVEATSQAADVEARGRFGSARVKTVSGDVSIETVEGDAAVKTTSGDVDVREIGGTAELGTVSGDLSLSTLHGDGRFDLVSGDLDVGQAAGSVTAGSVSGDQRIGAVTQGAVMLRSVSGDIEVGIRSGSRLWVDAKAQSGDTTSELELSGDPGADDGPLVELRATSVSGDVRVVRAGSDLFTIATTLESPKQAL